MKRMNVKIAMMAVMLATGMAVTGCRTTGTPEGVTPVKGFVLERYTGTWYEIARLDNTFERGLTKVMATYTPRPDGQLSVLNRGFDTKRNVWKNADAVGRFVGDPQTGALEVCFWGPFWGAYNIIALDPDYQWAVVCGSNRGYFWILARKPAMDKALLEELKAKAKAWGFATDQLVYPQH